jgi:AcrR family transcriptional regulator
MSPAPSRTSRTAIVAAGRALLEEEGLDAVTMATVASRVGVRAPSLYKHVRDRAALVAAIATDAGEEVGQVLAAADPGAGSDPAARLDGLARAFRTFARRSPRSAALLFLDLGPGAAAPVEVGARAARPVVEVAAALVGQDRALAAARVLTAFAYGFTSMEGAGAFRLGGSVDVSFDLGIATLAEGLRAARQTAATGEGG